MSKFGGSICGESVCRICKEKISMEEGVLFHHQIYHPRSKEAKQGRELDEKWKRKEEEKYYSICCGALMPDYPDSDFCPRCKEHTEVKEEKRIEEAIGNAEN